MFRVCNLLPRPLVDVCVSAVLYEERDDHELHQTAMEFSVDNLGSRPCPLFLSPLTFSHPLNPSSLNNTPSTKHFELVVFLTASQESTGSGYHKRTSYLPDEIQYGSCFTKVTSRLGKGWRKAESMRFWHAPLSAHTPEQHTGGALEKEHVVVQINGEGSDRVE